MTSIKDRLSKSQGAGNAVPKLEIAARIKLKEDATGKATFVTWDNEKKEDTLIDPPIKGILIGQAMEASSYSDNLGSKGGNYTSSYYFRNDESIALFAPSPKGYAIVAKGAMPVIEEYITKNSTSILKKRQVLFVLTEDGLVAVTTNLSIAIDQITAHKEELQEKYVLLNPQTFFEADTTISKKAKEYLGKFRQKNPPKYAAITVGDFISEEDFNNWKAESVIDEYMKWKEFKMKGGEEKVEPSAEVIETEAHTPGKITPNTGGVKSAEKKVIRTTAEDADPADDLPF